MIMNNIRNIPTKRDSLILRIQNELKYINLVDDVQNNQAGQNSYITEICLNILLAVQSHKSINTSRDKRLGIILGILKRLGMANTIHTNQYHLTSKGSRILNGLGIHQGMEFKVAKPTTINVKTMGRITKGSLGCLAFFIAIIGFIITVITIVKNSIQAFKTGFTVTGLVEPIIIALIMIVIFTGGRHIFLNNMTDIDMSGIMLPTVNTITENTFLKLLLASGLTKDNIHELNPYAMDVINHLMFNKRKDIN